MVDKNDNQPLIEEDCYYWNISEGSLPGQSFIEINASDIDLDRNAEICFSIPTNPDSKLLPYYIQHYSNAMSSLTRANLYPT